VHHNYIVFFQCYVNVQLFLKLNSYTRILNVPTHKHTDRTLKHSFTRSHIGTNYQMTISSHIVGMCLIQMCIVSANSNSNSNNNNSNSYMSNLTGKITNAIPEYINFQAFLVVIIIGTVVMISCGLIAVRLYQTFCEQDRRRRSIAASNRSMGSDDDL